MCGKRFFPKNQAAGENFNTGAKTHGRVWKLAKFSTFRPCPPMLVGYGEGGFSQFAHSHPLALSHFFTPLTFIA